MAKKKGRKVEDNRIRPILNDLIGTEKPEELFVQVQDALRDSQEKIPVPKGVYCFEYYAVTEPLLTDRFPIVGVTGVFDWGFTGMNLHLGEPRNYNFNNIASPIYRLKPKEVTAARALPLMDLYQI